MYQIKFTLKQHTPIIHFQHNQDGATLRASEVKPKLDRFIIGKLGNDDYERGRKIAQTSKWLIDNDKDALDYKMSIKPVQKLNIKMLPYSGPNNQGLYRPTYPNIFGNVKKGDRKYFSKTDENINVTIYSHNLAFNKKIEENIEHFFLTTNFGYRQSKGFGSFSLIELNSQPVNFDINNLRDTIHYININEQDDRKIFGVIDYIYKWLKSGINYSYNNNNRTCDNTRYKKSILFQYLQSKNPHNENWEKRWIKENFLELKPQTPPIYTPKYYRALLGLSDKHTFTKANCISNDNIVSEFQKNMNYKLELENSNKDIDRIKSPIIFKIIKTKKNNKNTTYILFTINKQTIDAIYNKDSTVNKIFLFYADKELNMDYRIGNNDYSIRYKYPEQDLTILNEHIERIKPHISISALRNKYKNIKNFIEQFKPIKLPNNGIDYNSLLNYFMTHHNNFKSKDFRWQNIIGESITIQKNKIK